MERTSSWIVFLGVASFAQTRLYLDERLRFDTSTNAVATYHIPLVYEVRHASLSVARLERALAALIRKHKILRTRLLLNHDHDELHQEILDQVQPTLILTTVDNDEAMQTILYDEETNPGLFSLAEGRVFRCHLVRRSASSDVLIFNFHHIAFDGASIEIFFRDLQHAYSTDAPLEPCVFDYLDYAMHERQMNMDEAKAFWTQHLDGFADTRLRLPYDRCPIDNHTRSGRGTTVVLQLSTELVEPMLNFIAEHHTTLHQLGLTAFYLFLFKLTQETDLTTLTVTANRPRPELEHIIGVCVNTLPHRVSIKPHLNFIAFVESTKELVAATLSHAHLPFQHIASITPMSSVQTLFDVDVQDNDEIALDSHACLRPFLATGTDAQSVAKFDLTCTLHHNVPTRSCTVAFNASSDLFERTTIELMARRFECLLGQLFTAPASTLICEYSLLLPHELELLTQVGHGDQLREQTPFLPVHQQFANQAHEHAQKLAVILDEQSLTYAEFFSSSQTVAQHLTDQCRVQRGDIVGQCVERSIEMSIGMMAILLSGASYLALSPHQSEERLGLLLDLAQPRCVLTHSVTERLVENICETVDVPTIVCRHRVFPLDSDDYDHVVMDDTAFLIFTSGSTGVPKVVPISHLRFTHQVRSYSQVQLHHKNDITIQMANCSFDEHVHEHMGSFYFGATLVLLRPYGNLDTRYLCKTVERHQATLIDFVPTTMAVVGEYLKSDQGSHTLQSLATLRLITVGGKVYFINTASLIHREPMQVNNFKENLSMACSIICPLLVSLSISTVLQSAR
jgi:non-ribosomal peptide synthetase component F